MTENGVNIAVEVMSHVEQVVCGDFQVLLRLKFWGQGLVKGIYI